MNGLTLKSKIVVLNNCINLMNNSFISKQIKNAQPIYECKVVRNNETFIELFEDLISQILITL